MSYQVLTILLTLLFISKLHTASATTDRTYVKTACNSTTYPKICYNSLSPYASKIKRNPQKLSKTALSITIKAAHKASSQVSKLLKVKKLTNFEAALIQDCVTNIKDSIDGLKQSLHAIDHLSASDKEFDDQMDDIKTWVSATLTNENTCTDGFDDEGKKVISATVKNEIKNSILKVVGLTSNALSLIDRTTISSTS
ncbi:pectinesterase inhibitor 4-like [Corylus avellana]|uniref:pectinesterase inhibitor 4-like n=1 Tax=Corylus avellana TaxID=13451 RepID=UPI00286A7A76|nr:pectinesterase inhibitor 4-like [Corylus avellana]